MIVNQFCTSLSMLGLIVFYLNISLAYSSSYSNLQYGGNNSIPKGTTAGGDNNHNKLNTQQNAIDVRSNLSELASRPAKLIVPPTTSKISSSLLLPKTLSNGFSVKSFTSLPPTYVYKADVPTHNHTELREIPLNLSNLTSNIKIPNNRSSVSMEKDGDLSKKLIGSR